LKSAQPLSFDYESTEIAFPAFPDFPGISITFVEYLLKQDYFFCKKYFGKK